MGFLHYPLDFSNDGIDYQAVNYQAVNYQAVNYQAVNYQAVIAKR
jgi:hypothetical protein